MITKSLELTNGVKINYIKTDKFKTNYISFNFISQIDKNSVHYNAMIPLILLRGCEKYPSQSELNKRLQYLYSADIGTKNEKLGEFQIFGLCADMLNDKYTQGTEVVRETVELLCDIIFNPYLENGAFSEKYTESEKINLIDTIEAEINNKTRYATNRCIEEMCKNEIFSVKKYGNIDDVKKIDAKNLYDAYKKALCEYKVEIYIVGDCDFELIANIFKSHFSKIKREVKELEKVKVIRKADNIKEICEKQNVNQGKLCMGFRTGRTIEDGNYHITQLFCEIFGGSPTSKLFLNVREKMSLCYYCRSVMTQRNAIMLVSAGIEPKNKEVAQKEILAQLNSIVEGKISEEELESAKKSLKNGYMHIYDSPEGMETWTLNRSLSNNHDIPATEAEKVENTTASQISDFAKNITLDTVYFLKGEENNG